MIFVSSLINTFFYSGKIPFAPGTMGSILAIIMWIIFQPSIYVLIGILFFLIFISSYTISTELFISEDKDPQHIVIDEAIGMLISLLFIPAYNIFHVLLAFILFRIFDIIKPSIIYRVQFTKGAWGVLLDDIIAGLFSGIIVLGVASL